MDAQGRGGGLCCCPRSDDDRRTAGGGQSAYAAEEAPTTGYVTCAAYRAATPAPEILGLTGVGTNDAFTTCGELEWTSPFYYIFGTTEYNSKANPYMLNSVSNYNDNTSYTNAMTYYTRKGGPNASMSAYGTDNNSDAVWNLLPDVILGTGNSASNQVDYNTDSYAVAAGAANGDEDYTTIGVNYQMTSIYTMITTMYDLAAAGDQVAADSNGTKSLRYGNATDIAKQYERYVKGTQGYVLKQLATNNTEKKTVALVNDYDTDSDTYTIVQTGVGEGTAASNRYLEAVQNVATNIADTKNSTTATKSELEAVDLIMLGSQSGQESITTTEDILNTFTDDMKNKTFWVDSDNGSAGSCYGVVMNSVENAQNIGRIIGCLYNEYIDQDQWIAYYYDNFYHLNSGKLADAIDYAMDGVRNWDATGSDLTLWTTEDATDYNESDVEAKLVEGVTYIEGGGDSVPSLLKMTANYGATSIAGCAISSIDDVTYTGIAFTPEPTVTLDNTTLVKDTDYTLSYTNNINAGKATVTVTGMGNYIGTKSVTFNILPISIVSASVGSVADQTYTGSAITPEPTVTLNGTALVKDTDYTLSYSDNVNIGTVTITVTGTGNYTDTATQTATFTISQANIASASVTPIANQTYTGSAITPKPTVTFGSNTLVEGTDYTLSYSDNVNVGTATITLTGMGNFTGSCSMTFEIVKVETQVMYRMYNPNSGEHFYTADSAEKESLVTAGWNYEGEGWKAPVTSSIPVYRLYNPNPGPNGSGEHHYTMSAEERDSLIDAGWSDEGIGWYSDEAQGVVLYREYNPNAFNCNHNYTTSKEEHDNLVGLGWDDEGTAWYGVA